MTSAITAPPAVAGIDPRAPRLAASLTAVVLALALVTPLPVAVVLLALQTGVFAVGTGRGIQHTPYAAVFRGVVRPRLAAPAELEDPRPPRFAQGLGLAFTATALVTLLLGTSLTGLTVVGLVATGLALVAALLNAVFGLCLGCELYLILRRASDR